MADDLDEIVLPQDDKQGGYMEKRTLLRDPVFLKKLIPSMTVRDYIARTCWAPTDVQLAVLIYHMGMGVMPEEKEDYWAALARETEDRALRDRLREALRHHEFAFLEKTYVPLPNPFERGDMVAMLDERSGTVKDYGIVLNTKKDWRVYHLQYYEGKRHPQYWDETIIVEFIDGRDGDFTHDHINPFYLEWREPWDETTQKYLRKGQALLRGIGSMQDLFWARDAYRKAHCGKSEEG